jgi:addiction module HigA family antidote
MSHTEDTPIHPGEVLREVYLKSPSPPLTVTAFAKTIDVPPQSVSKLIAGKRSITETMATRLAVVCRTTPEYWRGLQRTYDVQVGKRTRARRRGNKQLTHPATAA